MGLFGSKSDDNSKDVFSRLGKEVKEDMMVFLSIFVNSDSCSNVGYVCDFE